jgi:hypothetical protein
VFFPAVFTVLFAAGLRVVFWEAFFTLSFPAVCELETRLTARFAAICTAATAPLTELLMDVTA